jgi:hypothetical protein
MTDIRIREAAVTMSMVDGEALTPQQMARIVAAVLAELRRRDEDEHRRRQDTRVAGSRPIADGWGRK